ncbi:hypothetical protein KBA73_01680 [Patescibacteria group bacterium]|nr:hypothetical protein [Patescibacteria group bacterium]
MRYFVAALIAGIVYQLAPTFGLGSHRASLVIASLFVGLTLAGPRIVGRNLVSLRERIHWKLHEETYKGSFIFPTWLIGIFGCIEFVRWSAEKLVPDLSAGWDWHAHTLARHVLMMQGVFYIQLLYLVGWTVFLLIDLVYSDDDKERLLADPKTKRSSSREDLLAYLWAVPFAIIPIGLWIWKSVLPALVELAQELSEDVRRYTVYRHHLEDNASLGTVFLWWLAHIGRGLWSGITNLLPRVMLWTVRAVLLIAAACIATILKPTEARSVLFLSEVFLLVSWAKMQGALTSRTIGIGLLIAALHVTVGFFLGDRLSLAIKRTMGRAQVATTSTDSL